MARSVNLQRRRECAESTYPLDTRQFLHHRDLQRRPRVVSRYDFSDGASVLVDVCDMGEKTVTVGFDVCPYTFKPNAPHDDQNPKHLQVLQVRPLRQNFGAQRFFVVCPLCDCSANILYLPKGANAFACRRCFGLAYASETLHGTRYGRFLSDCERDFEQAACKYLQSAFQ